jgi:hypothetical protein
VNRDEIVGRIVARREAVERGWGRSREGRDLTVWRERETRRVRTQVDEVLAAMDTP